LRHPEDRPKVVDGFQQTLKDGTDYYESEYRIVRPDGQLRWILGRGRVVRDALGRPVRYFGVDIDITNRKRVETELRAAQAHFLSVFQLAPIAMSLSTLRDGRYIDVNAALLAQTGYRREEIVGRTAGELSVYVEERDFERVRSVLADTGKVRGLELRLRGKEDVRTVLFSADIIAFGDEQCLLTACVDITDRKVAESALSQSEQRYRDLVDNANDIVAISICRGGLHRSIRRSSGYWDRGQRSLSACRWRALSLRVNCQSTNPCFAANSKAKGQRGTRPIFSRKTVDASRSKSTQS
jgi:PAS domain S-box-containing protein